MEVSIHGEVMRLTKDGQTVLGSPVRIPYNVYAEPSLRVWVFVVFVDYVLSHAVCYTATTYLIGRVDR